MPVYLLLAWKSDIFMNIQILLRHVREASMKINGSTARVILKLITILLLQPELIIDGLFSSLKHVSLRISLNIELDKRYLFTLQLVLVVRFILVLQTLQVLLTQTFFHRPIPLLYSFD